jgi:hypothetical protein
MFYDLYFSTNLTILLESSRIQATKIQIFYSQFYIWRQKHIPNKLNQDVAARGILAYKCEKNLIVYTKRMYLARI